MNHEERNRFLRDEFDKIMRIAESKGIEYSNSDIDANLNFYSDEEIGISALQSVGVFMNKHYRSIRSFLKNGETFSEPIEGRIHDLILYGLIMLSIIKEKEEKKLPF